MPPERSGIADYSALLLPALRERLDVERRQARDEAPAARHRSRRLPRRQQPRRARLDRRRAAAAARRRRPARLRPPPPGRRRHDRPARRARLPRRDGARARRRRPAARRTACSTSGCRRSGRRARRTSRSRARCSRSRRVSSCTRATSRIVRGRPGFDGPDLRTCRIPRGPTRASSRRRSTGDPLIGAFGNVNASKRVPQLLEAFARVRAEHPGARLLLVGATSPGFDLERRLQRLGLGGDGIVREGYVDERRLWELMAACDVHVSLRSPTMGETSGTAIRALSLGKPLVVCDVGWFARASGRRRAQGCRRRRRGDRPRGGAASSSPSGPTCARRWAPPRASSPRPSTISAVSPTCRRRRSSRSRAAAPSRTTVVREVSEAAAEVGIAPGSPEASEIARRLAEVDLGG